MRHQSIDDPPKNFGQKFHFDVSVKVSCYVFHVLNRTIWKCLAFGAQHLSLFNHISFITLINVCFQVTLFTFNQ